MDSELIVRRVAARLLVGSVAGADRMVFESLAAEMFGALCAPDVFAPPMSPVTSIITVPVCEAVAGSTTPGAPYSSSRRVCDAAAVLQRVADEFRRGARDGLVRRHADCGGELLGLLCQPDTVRVLEAVVACSPSHVTTVPHVGALLAEVVALADALAASPGAVDSFAQVCADRHVPTLAAFRELVGAASTHG